MKINKDTVMAYKAASKNFINITHDEIEARIGGDSIVATRKYDGEMAVLFFDGKEAAIVNRSGVTRTGFPCVEDAKNALIAAGVKQAVIPSELYADESQGRTRVFHVLAALKDESKFDTLRLAAFDILELNDEPFKANSYTEIHAKLGELFEKAKLCHVVEGKACKTVKDVQALYAQWVEKDGGEGLVVRSSLPLVFKVKAKHNIDAAIVGFSEGTGEAKGRLRAVLLAMMPRENEYQIIGKTGGGFSDESRVDLYNQFSPLAMESKYIETDSNHVAFRMIKPEFVVEVSISDVLFETSKDLIENPLLCIENGVYVCKKNVQGLSVVSPNFVRFRDDKKAVYDDIRLEQINDFTFIEPANETAEKPGAAAELLKREVYKKESGGKLMVIKFMVWKTNKETKDFPRYVFHYTNYSSDRKDPLQREVSVSDDEAQIMELYQQSIEANVKKGWNAVS